MNFIEGRLVQKTPVELPSKLKVASTLQFLRKKRSAFRRQWDSQWFSEFDRSILWLGIPTFQL